jgi:hypothetical protein
VTELFTYVETPWGPSVQNAGPALLADLLPTYEAEILAHVADPTLVRRPGTPTGEVKSLLERVGLGAPAELLTWFEWTAGEAQITAARPYPFMSPMSAQWTTESYALLRDGDANAAIQLAELTEEERGWGAPAGWLRLERENSSIAMYCGGVPRDAAPMRYASPFFGTTETFGSNQFLSLSTLIAWSIEAIRSGATWWTGQRWRHDLGRLPPSQVAAGIVN